MKLGIKSKLIGALLIINGFLAFSIYYLNSISFDKDFLAYINHQQEAKLNPMVEILSKGYKKFDNWQWILKRPGVWSYILHLHRNGNLDTVTLDALLSNARQNHQRMPPEHSGSFVPPPPPIRGTPNNFNHQAGGPPPFPGPRFPPGAGRLPPAPNTSFEYGTIFFRDQLGQLQIGPPELEDKVNWINIISDGKVAGQLGYVPQKKIQEQVDLFFAQQQKQSFAYIAVFLVIIALMIAIVLSNHFLKPIRSLKKGVHQLVSGDYVQILSVTSQDELGQLVNDFNYLSKTLEQNKTDRRQWIVDISHELRTPVAVLQSEIEAILDQVRPLSYEAMQSLQHETKRLKRLITDLHELSMSDLGAQSYKMENFDLIELIEEFIEDNEQRIKAAGLGFETLFQNQKAMIHADAGRIEQLFANLMQNSIRYTDKPGIIKLTIARFKQTIEVNWSDSSPGVSSKDLPRLFERLYRVDASRNSASGGSGLGLAICLNIVNAHNGSISAVQSELGGLEIQLKLPLVQK